jgi:hypothetical protein
MKLHIGGHKELRRAASIEDGFKEKIKAKDFAKLFDATQSHYGKAIFLALFWKAGDRESVKEILKNISAKFKAEFIITAFTKMITGRSSIEDAIEEAYLYEPDTVLNEFTSLYDKIKL